MNAKPHLATLAHYPSLLVSSTAKTALMEIERLEADLAIAVEALDGVLRSTAECENWTGRLAAIDELAASALAKIREMK